MAKYNIPADRVIRHHDVTGKICPNPYVWNHTKHTWDGFKAALVAPAEYMLGWNNDKYGWWYADRSRSGMCAVCVRSGGSTAHWRVS